MKATIQNKPGLLIPYDEFLRKLHVPQQFLVYRIIDHGRTMELRLILRESIQWLDQNLLLIDEKPMLSFLRSKKLFHEAFGIDYEYIEVEFFAKQREAKHPHWLRMWGIPDSTDIFLSQNRLYAWIAEDNEDWRRADIAIEPNTA